MVKKKRRMKRIRWISKMENSKNMELNKQMAIAASS